MDQAPWESRVSPDHVGTTCQPGTQPVNPEPSGEFHSRMGPSEDPGVGLYPRIGEPRESRTGSVPDDSSKRRRDLHIVKVDKSFQKDGKKASLNAKYGVTLVFSRKMGSFSMKSWNTSSSKGGTKSSHSSNKRKTSFRKRRGSKSTDSSQSSETGGSPSDPRSLSSTDTISREETDSSSSRTLSRKRRHKKAATIGMLTDPTRFQLPSHFRGRDKSSSRYTISNMIKSMQLLIVLPEHHCCGYVVQGYNPPTKVKLLTNFTKRCEEKITSREALKLLLLNHFVKGSILAVLESQASSKWLDGIRILLKVGKVSKELADAQQ